MRGILLVDGWQKEVEITLDQYNSGVVQVVMYPPLYTCVQKGPPPRATYVQIKLYNKGKVIMGLPVYEEI